MKSKKPKKNPFAKDYAPYGTYSGERGNSDQWAGAFKERMSPEQIETILKDESPWGILGVKPGATQAEIKSAFRKRSLETHPDQTGLDGSEFRKVKAAYDKLT